MRWDLAGKAALVTGAGSGIGQAIALELARQGAKVAAADVNAGAAEATARQAREHGAVVMPIAMDVSRSEEVRKGAAAAEARFGPLDALVNVAGFFEESPALEISDEQWARMLAVHLNGTFYTCRAVVPGMVARRSGVVVNMSSLHALRGQANGAHYAAAKGGIIGFTKSLAREVSPHGVRVNAVAPGPIDTPMWRSGASGPALEARKRERSKVIPLGRLGEADEVAGAVLFLLSPASSYATGQVISVNGGELMV